MAHPRRLPIYVLIDTSADMAGDPISAMQIGLSLLISDLNSEPSALETAWLSIVTFGGPAMQIVPLTSVADVQIPRLVAGGGSCLGGALQLLNACLDREVIWLNNDRKGDWLPLVLLFVSGRPSDVWVDAADRLHDHSLGRLVAVICGNLWPDSLDAQRRLTPDVMRANDLGPDTFKAFLRWQSNTNRC